MPLLSEASALYIGDVPVTKAYMGGVQVWAAPTGGGWGPPERMLPDAQPTGGGAYAGTYTLAAQFHVEASGRITHFRVWIPTAAGTGSYSHKLWTTDGVERAAVVDSGGPTGVFREVPLPAPYLVGVGDYRVGANAVAAGTSYDIGAVPPTSLATNLTSYQGYYGTGHDVYPVTSAGGSWYGVDVVYQKAL